MIALAAGTGSCYASRRAYPELRAEIRDRDSVIASLNALNEMWQHRNSMALRADSVAGIIGVTTNGDSIKLIWRSGSGHPVDR
jgi:hypothetical protein